MVEMVQTWKGGFSQQKAKFFTYKYWFFPSLIFILNVVFVCLFAWWRGNSSKICKTSCVIWLKKMFVSNLLCVLIFYVWKWLHLAILSMFVPQNCQGYFLTLNLSSSEHSLGGTIFTSVTNRLGARIACWLERRTRDWKVVSLNPGTRFSSPESTLCADSYSVSVPLPCYHSGM